MSTEIMKHASAPETPAAYVNLDDIPNIPDEMLDVPLPQVLYAFWVNGKPAMKKNGGISYSGGWAIDAGKVNPDLLDPAIWTMEELITKEGEAVQVFAAPVVRAAIIGYRASWIDQDKPPHFFREFRLKLRHYVEISCRLDGVREPVCLSAKGYNGGNLLSAYAKGVNEVRVAIKMTKPPFAFWMPFGPEINDAGVPQFTKVGTGEQQSGIVKIVTRFSKKPDLGWAQANVVPPAVFEFCASQLPFLKPWKEQRFLQQAQRDVALQTNIPEDPPDDEDGVPFE